MRGEMPGKSKNRGWARCRNGEGREISSIFARSVIFMR
jgi:hypothetical protein